jgi:hypothetical protein
LAQCILVRAIKFGGARLHPGPEPIDLPEDIIAALPPGTVRPVAPPPPALRTDGPTLEEFISAGYKAEHYPPQGYAEKDSEGLRAYRVEQKAEALRQAQARVATVVGSAAAAEREKDKRTKEVAASKK